MGRLDGKVAIITGGNSGIGLATAKEFVAQGARVIITGRRPDAVEAASQDLGENAAGIVADAASLTDIDKLVSEVGNRFDRIDVLFLNAGMAPFASIAEQDEAGFDRLIAVNLKGPYFTVQKALPLLSEGASVFFNTSAANVKGLPGTSVYASTKAALRSMTRTLAVELAERKIRVNSLSPGAIGTPLWDKTGMEQAEIDEMGQNLGTLVPLGRFGTPEEMAQVATFLASDESSYITGAEITADGGFAQV